MQDVTTKHKLSADAVVAYNYAYACDVRKKTVVASCVTSFAPSHEKE